MIITYPKDGAFYYALGKRFIIADHPEAYKAMARSPEIPAINQRALDLICELTTAKASAEAKVALLKRAIESL